jgi:RND family efflux transporter MFP subunit
VAPPGIGVFRVVNTNRMKLVARLADSYLSYVKPNDPVQVVIRETGDTINANITFISKSVNLMNRTFTIEADLKNLPASVRPNMIANVSINDKNLENALVINSNIVQRDQTGQNFVLVSETQNGTMTAKKKMVKIGLIYRDKVVIEEGLKVGEKIITTGYQEAADGQTLLIN